MPAVWFGTVVLWSVVEQKKRGKREKPGGDQNSGDQRRPGKRHLSWASKFLGWE